LFFLIFFSCGRHCSVAIALYQVSTIMFTIMLTVGGVECTFSLALDQDHVPLEIE
jgi:hypothetical protein